MRDELAPFGRAHPGENMHRLTALKAATAISCLDSRRRRQLARLTIRCPEPRHCRLAVVYVMASRLHEHQRPLLLPPGRGLLLWREKPAETRLSAEHREERRWFRFSDEPAEFGPPVQPPDDYWEAKGPAMLDFNWARYGLPPVPRWPVACRCSPAGWTIDRSFVIEHLPGCDEKARTVQLATAATR